jgi:hypothetical protein
MPESVRDAVFGTIGTLICFTGGPTDAHFLEREFAPTFLENDLINLGRYEMYLKLQVEDTQSQAFSARSLPPLKNGTGMREKAIAASRAKYGRPVERVEKIIKKWTETRFRPGQPPEPPAWAVKEEQRVKEVPVEGEQSVEAETQPMPKAVSPQPTQTPPPFVRESVPGLADNPASNVSQEQPEKNSEVDIFHFPQVKQVPEGLPNRGDDPERHSEVGYKGDSPKRIESDSPPES